MRRFFVRFNRSESFAHTQSSAGFTIITSGFEFSVHTGHAETLLWALGPIAIFYSRSGHYAAANRALNELGALADEIGASAWKTTAEITGRGRLFALEGKPAEAVQLLTSGLSDAAQRSTGTTHHQSWNLYCLAHAHAELGHFDEAWRRIGEAIQLRLYQVKGDKHEEVTDHDLLDFLDGINDQMTGIEFKYTMMAHLELTGIGHNTCLSLI
jgi:hypothetical protein